MPNCTIIKTGATVTPTPSERVSELKSLIDGIEIPYNPHYVGDVALYDATTGSLVFASADADFAVQYPASQYTPIGVVAVPNTHDVYGKRKCGVVSLKGMSYSTPDEGSTSSQTMYWGYNNLLLGKGYTDVVQTGTCYEPTVEATGTATSGFAYVPSDNFNGTQSATDMEASYSANAMNAAASPSPYLEDGSRNPVYYQTTDPSSELNCLADFDGVDNTQLILNAVTVSDWQTASTISNSYSSGNYPAACCCWRYHTVGTSQGDWYLPACGEVGYVMVRLKTINATITNLIEAYGDEIGGLLPTSSSSYLWSSSEYSSSGARNVNVGNGYVNNRDKSTDNYVRAFLRV